MKFWVGLTDRDWFEFLSQRQPDEVNFWKPGSARKVKIISPGELFLFKLKRPFRSIVGGGFFVRYSLLPLSLTWEAFEDKNGVSSLEEFRSKIYQPDYHRRRKRKLGAEHDPAIGCIILAQPFFFAEADWIPEPEDWNQVLVQGKTYDTQEPIGVLLWEQVQTRLVKYNVSLTGYVPQPSPISQKAQRYGPETLVRPRLGQGAFRVVVTEAYNRRCAITGERTLPALTAAHIKPYAKSGPHDLRNGILLRADLHMLLDRGYLTITKDLRVEVSRRIQEEYENGREYYTLNGKRLVAIPSREIDRPDIEFIEWHNSNVFLA